MAGDDKRKKSASLLLESVVQAFIALERKDARLLLFDPVRHKERVEMPAGLLYGLCALGRADDTLAERCAAMLLAARNAQGLWHEAAYAPDDEPVEFYGLVPSAFALLSLAEYSRLSGKRGLLRELLTACDAIYATERNGTLVKAVHNRSRVLNTNLLAAQALLDVSGLLPEMSNRRRMYRGLAERVVRRVLGYQAPGGFFPYHFETLAVPVLYQAMVVGQLRNLLHVFPQEIVCLAVRNGIGALCSFFEPRGAIVWEKANNHDKRGALWAYTFALAAIGAEHPLFENICVLLAGWRRDGFFTGEEGADAADPFFSAWMIFGLVWALRAPRLPRRFSVCTRLKRLWLIGEYCGTAARFLCAYASHRIRSGIFPCGTLENTRW